MQTEQSAVRIRFVEWVLTLSDDECRAALMAAQLVRDAPSIRIAYSDSDISPMKTK